MTASAGSNDRTFVFVHPSDELYGADRMLLAQLDALRGWGTPEVWLPIDVDYPEHQLCRELQRRGVAVRHLDLPVLRRAYRRPLALARLGVRALRIAVTLRRAAPDVLYCTTSAGLLIAPIARLTRVPVVIGHVQELWGGTERKVLTGPARACHALVAISDFVAEQLPARLRVRTTVVPNGTPEPDEVTPLAGRTGPLVLMIASRWNGWKGHRTLLTAWRSVTGARLLVLGGPPSSGERVDVEALVAQLPDPTSVDIVGEVPDAADRLSGADVVLMPSDQPEPFGLVAIEAFARGRPVVASNAGGLADIVTDGVDGWLFERGDPDDLARVISSLDRETVRAAGGRARETYLRRFTLERYADRWRAAVDGVTGSARR